MPMCRAEVVLAKHTASMTDNIAACILIGMNSLPGPGEEGLLQQRM